MKMHAKCDDLYPTHIMPFLVDDYICTVVLGHNTIDC